MGGYGSGRWRIGKDVVEKCRTLDINRFAREGKLSSSAFYWHWINEKEETSASIIVWPELNGIRLLYTYTCFGHKQDMDYLVPVVYIHVGYGERPYFLCPRCGARCLKLYMNSPYFICRTCANLAYNCQREKEADRLMRRARKIRRKIGASMSMLDSILLWNKPKRMRWDTFIQLKSQVQNFESMVWSIAAKELGLRM